MPCEKLTRCWRLQLSPCVLNANRTEKSQHAAKASKGSYGWCLLSANSETERNEEAKLPLQSTCRTKPRTQEENYDAADHCGQSLATSNRTDAEPKCILVTYVNTLSKADC